MTATLLDLHVTTTGDDTVVRVGGKIDIASVAELRHCLRQTVDAGSRRLVVDLRQVSLMDSVGLGVLIGARRRLRGQASDQASDQGHDDRSMQLVCADGPAMRILRLTGLDRVFALHATLADALADDLGQGGDQSG